MRPGKAMFKAAFPNATIESHKPNFDPRYYLVRKMPRSFMYSGEGKTPGDAWRDACYAKDLAERQVKP